MFSKVLGSVDKIDVLPMEISDPARAAYKYCSWFFLKIYLLIYPFYRDHRGYGTSYRDYLGHGMSYRV